MDGIRELGVSTFGIMEPAGEPCDLCDDRPGTPQRCPTDKAFHRHGMCHLRTTEGFWLVWLCDSCQRAEWDAEVSR